MSPSAESACGGEGSRKIDEKLLSECSGEEVGDRGQGLCVLHSFLLYLFSVAAITNYHKLRP